MEWEAWFTDGRRFASPGWDPEELPGDGCLGIVKYLPEETSVGHPHRQILSGDDFYLYVDGEWISNSHEDNAERYPEAIVVRGIWARHSEMKRVQRQMAEAKEPPSCRR